MVSQNMCGVSGRAWTPIRVAFRDKPNAQPGEVPCIQYQRFGAVIAFILAGQR
jgi:hypothetical protein